MLGMPKRDFNVFSHMFSIGKIGILEQFCDGWGEHQHMGHLALGLHASTSNCLYFVGILTWISHDPEWFSLKFDGFWWFLIMLEIQHTSSRILQRPPSFRCVEITGVWLPKEVLQEEDLSICGICWELSGMSVLVMWYVIKRTPKLLRHFHGSFSLGVLYACSTGCIGVAPKIAKPSALKKDLLPRPIYHSAQTNPRGIRVYIYDILRSFMYM